MKFLNMILKKMDLFDTRCEYISTCALYKDDSFMCTKELDKHYCGAYKQYKKRPKMLYIKI